MDTVRKAVFFFCQDRRRDPVAKSVFDFLNDHVALEPNGQTVDGLPVVLHRDARGNCFTFVRTDDVLSHAYDRYLPCLRQSFGDADVAAVINWHEGANAPDRVLTVHTTGDVPSGCFGPADPVAIRQLLLAIEHYRNTLGLTTFSTTTEGTHWSGVAYGAPPELLLRYQVPLVDIEIGSTPTSWTNASAIEVIARSLLHILDVDPTRSRSLLCVGGVHMEASFPAAVLQGDGPHALSVSHVLPNQWLITGQYDDEGGERKLAACVESIRGGIDGVVFHDNLKGPLKAVVRQLGEKLGVPVFKHQRLRRPSELALWSN